MKELPILFSAPMILALLAGRKTQTRRIMKPIKDRDFGNELAPRELAGEVNSGHYRNCPYGAPGDHLWAREAHAFSVVDPDGLDWHDDPENWDVIYRADARQPSGGWRDANGKPMTAPWRPSIHMPRWASRITLEVTQVRVERLQSISEVDAQDEGLIPLSEGMDRTWTVDGTAATEYETGREAYQHLWEEINGPDSWSTNPWVWVIEFRRVS